MYAVKFSTSETLELEHDARGAIKIESGRVAFLGFESLRVATRNSGVQASTKSLDISPSLNSEVPPPERIPTCSLLPPSEFEAGVQPRAIPAGSQGEDVEPNPQT